jgi:hypothetical protein
MSLNIREVLDKFITVEILRLCLLDGADETELYKKLSSAHLTADSIANDLANELAKLLAYEHDTEMQKSTRKGGRGWSKDVIEEQMRRLLNKKLDAIAYQLGAAAEEPCKKRARTEVIQDFVIDTE